MLAIMARLLLERSIETPDGGSDDSGDFLAALAYELDKGEDQ
jgi:hypothetical protein